MKKRENLGKMEWVATLQTVRMWERSLDKQERQEVIGLEKRNGNSS